MLPATCNISRCSVTDVLGDICIAVLVKYHTVFCYWCLGDVCIAFFFCKTAQYVVHVVFFQLILLLFICLLFHGWCFNCKEGSIIRGFLFIKSGPRFEMGFMSHGNQEELWILFGKKKCRKTWRYTLEAEAKVKVQ